MKTNHYESVVILNASLEDDQIDSTLNRIEDQITQSGGKISDTEKWGRKRLAYPIQKSKSGYYIVYRFEAPRDLISKLERNYRLDENIIRYLTITLEKKDLEFVEQMKAKKESAEEVVKNEQTENVADKK
ncbi:MAG: 30S ribosomal protein S6 [Bacteroidota bacterium]